MTQDLFYYESGYIDDSYFVYTADAESAQSATSTISCDATKIAGGVAVFGSGDLPSSVTLTCTISHINGADIFAFSDALLAAEAGRIRDNNIQSSAQFSIATDAVRGIYVSAQADSAVLVAVTNQRVRNNEAAANAAFSLTASVGSIQSTQVAISGDFTPTLTASILKNSFAVIDCTSSVTAIPDNFVKNVSADISCTAQQFTVGLRIQKSTAAITSTSSVTSELTEYFLQCQWYINQNNSYPVTYNSTYRVGSSGASISIPRATYSGENTVRLLGLNAIDETLLEPGTKDFTIEFAAHVQIENITVQRICNLAGIEVWAGMTNGFRRLQVKVTTSTNSYTYGNFLYGDHQDINSLYNSVAYFAITRSGNTFSVYYKETSNSTFWQNLYTGTIAGSLTDGRYSFFGASYSTPTIIDEFRLTLGNARYTGSNPSAPTSYPLNKGSALILTHFDNNLALDQGIIETAASLTSTSAANSIIGVVKLFDSTLSAGTFVTAVAGRIRPFVDIESGIFSVSANINVVTDTASSINSTITVDAIATKELGPIESNIAVTSTASATGTFTLGAFADITALSSTTSAFGRIRPFIDITSGQFTLDATAETGLIAGSDITATSQLSATATKQIGAILAQSSVSSSLTVNAVVTTDNSVAMGTTTATVTVVARIRPFVSVEAGQFTVAAIGDVNKPFASALSTSTTLTTTTDRIRSADAIIISAGSFSTFVTVQGATASDMNVTSSMSTTGRVLRGLTSSSTSTSAVTATLVKIQRTTISTTSLSTIVLYPETVKVFDAEINSAADLTATISHTESVEITAFSSSLQVTAISVNRTANVAISTTSALNSTGNLIKPLNSAIIGNSLVNVQISKIISANATITAFDTVMIIGKVINLAASEIYVVPRDTTSWTISSDVNLWTVPEENRTYLIKE